MPAAGELLVLLVMLVGLAGVFVPVLPGLLLIWAAGVAWAWLDGWGPARIAVVVLLTLLLVGGTVAKYVLPARSATGAGAPKRTLLLGTLGAVAGFFVIPVLGALIGGVVGIYLAEMARLGSSDQARSSTWAVLKAVGLGVLVELVAGVVMVGLWVLAAVAT